MYKSDSSVELKIGNLEIFRYFFIDDYGSPDPKGGYDGSQGFWYRVILARILMPSFFSVKFPMFAFKWLGLGLELGLGLVRVRVSVRVRVRVRI